MKLRVLRGGVFLFQLLCQLVRWCFSSLVIIPYSLAVVRYASTIIFSGFSIFGSVIDLYLGASTCLEWSRQRLSLPLRMWRHFCRGLVVFMFCSICCSNIVQGVCSGST